MMIKYGNNLTPFTILLSQEGQLIQFLKRKGFNPKKIADRTIEVSKEFNLYDVDDDWEKFTGYDVLKTKLLAQQQYSKRY